MNWPDIILVIKYVIATMIVIAIVLAPWYLAVQTGKNKPTTMAVRLASTVFFLSGIGWFIALFLSTRK